MDRVTEFYSRTGTWWGRAEAQVDERAAAITELLPEQHEYLAVLSHQ